MAQVTVSVRMPPDLHAALSRAAADELISGAALMRRLALRELRAKGYAPAPSPEVAAHG